MEAIPQGQKGACDGLYRPLKLTVLLDQKDLEPVANAMGTAVARLQLQNGLQAGKPRREARRTKETAAVLS